MNTDKIKKMLAEGEGLTVEFKECAQKVGRSVFATVCSFSNRYGGYILLGVKDTGEVVGVDSAAALDMKKNFINVLNDSQLFSPTLFLSLEEAYVEGKLILWVQVPSESGVVMFGDKIYDRAEDGDIDITRKSEQVAQLHLRKSREFSERKLFPYVTEEHLELDRLMPRVRRLVQNRDSDHPWLGMSDMQILQSAGLYQVDFVTGQKGFNLAAILLFGREEVILSCAANYLTDAIYRVNNPDRHDDRQIVKVNLIDAYERLTEFLNRHMPDPFFLEGDQSISVRSKIARELVSNSLVHREYASAYPAKIIVERDRVITENWSLPKNPGRLDRDTFTPYPKNPLLANFFVQIGRADTLGSGVRNLYRFTELYSGQEPELVDGDVFMAIVPFGSLSDKVSDNAGMSDKVSDKVSDNAGMSDKVSDNIRAIVAYLEEHGEISTQIASQIIELSPPAARRILTRMVSGGLLKKEGGRRNRTYRLINR